MIVLGILSVAVVVRVEMVGVELIQQHERVNWCLEVWVHYLQRRFLINHLIAYV